MKDDAKQDYSDIERQLLQRRAELEHRVDSIKENIGTPLDHDFAEQAVERENGEVLDALGKGAEAEIARINRALIRMQEGYYGECEDCGERIALERLKARPFSTRCIRCANQYEEAEKRR